MSIAAIFESLVNSMKYSGGSTVKSKNEFKMDIFERYFQLTNHHLEHLFLIRKRDEDIARVEHKQNYCNHT